MIKKYKSSIVQVNVRLGLSVIFLGFQSLAVQAATPIINCTDLQSIQNDLSGEYELVADIDCTEMSFSPIGTTRAPFMGKLDGKGYKISNLIIDKIDTDYVGLFGITYGVTYNDGTYESAIIKNIVLDNSIINGRNHVGALIGMARNTDVSSIKVQGKITGKRYTGGIIGDTADKITFSNLSADGEVLGDTQVGGLIGMTNTIINNSHANVNVKGTEDVGGLIGSTNSDVYDSYASGKVIGYAFTGGIAGRAKSIYNSHATGDILGAPTVDAVAPRAVGGLAGYVGHIKNSYATGNVNAKASNLVGGLAGCVNGEVDSSYATGNIIGSTGVGGLIGSVGSCFIPASSYATNITKSYATGNVSGMGAVGGLIGVAGGKRAQLPPYTLSVNNSYARGDAKIRDDAKFPLGGGNGGLIGTAAFLITSNCYATGEINGPFYTQSGELYSGGLIGYGSTNTTTKNSYWDSQTSGTSYSAGGEAKRTIELFQQTSFQEWDFSKIWEIKERKGYPTLRSTQKS